LDFDNFNSVDAYGGDRVYCNSKLANVLMSNELARKLSGTGKAVAVAVVDREVSRSQCGGSPMAVISVL
jgi:NAD(P)-dependent dehydrogenase (short-subunit alcohol dehydrogenase family)